jgi:hypothetical protein
MIMNSGWRCNNFIELLIMFRMYAYFECLFICFAFLFKDNLFRYLSYYLLLDRELKYHNSGTIPRILNIHES